MSNHFALFSMIFMMSFVVLFDDVHRRNRCTRVLSGLMTREELDRLLSLWTACHDA
jgi:hypothetical protein